METSFAAVKKFLPMGTGSPSSSTQSNGVGGLPFSYADAAHTKPAPAPKNASGSGWMPAWLRSSGNANNAFPSSAASSSYSSSSWWDTLGLTRMQRYTAFAICWLAALLLFFLAILHLPVSVLNPRKFVVPYCLASLLVAFSFGFIHGFVSYFGHLVAPDRRWMSLAFYGCTAITLYVATIRESYILTAAFAFIHGITMAAYVISYLPGGRAGLSTMASMATGMVL